MTSWQDKAEFSRWLEEDPESQWRFVIHIWYEGPFERAMNWLLAIDRETNEVWRDVPDGSPRSWLADRAEDLDRIWRDWYVRRHRRPPSRWLRGEPG